MIFFQKLSRIGLNVRLLHETHLLVSTFATHDDRDCMIFVTNQGSHSELQSIAQVATHYSIPIITISSTANNPVAQIADYALIYSAELMKMKCVWRLQRHYLHSYSR